MSSCCWPSGHRALACWSADHKCAYSWPAEGMRSLCTFCLQSASTEQCSFHLQPACYHQAQHVQKGTTQGCQLFACAMHLRSLSTFWPVRVKQKLAALLLHIVEVSSQGTQSAAPTTRASLAQLEKRQAVTKCTPLTCVRLLFCMLSCISLTSNSAWVMRCTASVRSLATSPRRRTRLSCKWAAKLLK